MPGSEALPHREPVWRYVQPRCGRAWVKAAHGRLRGGIQVKVTETSNAGMVAWVETDWGLSKRMFCHHLDFGLEFRARSGEWIPESYPRARRWLLRVRGELLAGSPPRHTRDYGHLLTLEEVERVLRRNGCLNAPSFVPFAR
jgi:hypothetical protein